MPGSQGVSRIEPGSVGLLPTVDNSNPFLFRTFPIWFSPRSWRRRKPDQRGYPLGFGHYRHTQPSQSRIAYPHPLPPRMIKRAPVRAVGSGANPDGEMIMEQAKSNSLYARQLPAVSRTTKPLVRGKVYR